jgi:hypothetical protein
VKECLAVAGCWLRGWPRCCRDVGLQAARVSRAMQHSKAAKRRLTYLIARGQGLQYLKRSREFLNITSSTTSRPPQHHVLHNITTVTSHGANALFGCRHKITPAICCISGRIRGKETTTFELLLGVDQLPWRLCLLTPPSTPRLQLHSSCACAK